LATAAQNFLLVAPAAADPQLFANFSRIVNHYLEAPPFKFTNAYKNKGVLKNVRLQFRFSSLAATLLLLNE
jgi:hypothetical protein